MRELDLADEGIVQAVLNEPPNGDEIQAIIQKREERFFCMDPHILKQGVVKLARNFSRSGKLS